MKAPYGCFAARRCGKLPEPPGPSRRRRQGGRGLYRMAARAQAARLCGPRDLHVHGESGAGGDRDEGVETEFADTAAQQVIEARLSHAETLRRLGLRNAP